MPAPWWNPSRPRATFIRPSAAQVVEVNKAVVDNPALANTEPYGGGWFFKIKLSHAGELSGLLTPEQYKKQVGG